MELFDAVITSEAKQKVLECLNSGYLSEGKLVKEFEQELEKTFGYNYGVAVNSGTSALHLVLHEIGIKAGDEVIIPSQTFIATGLAVLMCGGRVVFADIDIDTGNISVSDVEKKITYRTRAVIAVAWGGNPPDLDDLVSLCNSKNIYLIQDNAQALGATYKGTPVTKWGDFSCFSFQATKHLTTGDGGLIVARDRVDYEILKDLRWFGISRERDLPDVTGERQYTLHDLGFKYHMNDYAAALGIGNLRYAKSLIDYRRTVAKYYRKNIKWGQYVERDYGCSYWIYDLLVRDRDEFLVTMRERGVPVSVVHQGIHTQPIFGWNRELSGQEYWDRHHVSLPCHPSMTWEDVEKVVDAVNAGW